MSKELSKSEPVVVSKFAAIAADTAEASKAQRSASKRMGKVVDTIAPTVFLAFSTGYVSVERMTKDERQAFELAGGISQNDYRKLFLTEQGEPVSATTIRRWKLWGAAIAAGVDGSTLAALKRNGGKMAIALEDHLLSGKATPESIVKAIDKAEKVKALESGKSDESTDEGDKRAAQIPTHEATQGELVAALVATVGALDPEKFSADEWTQVLDAMTVLASKTAGYEVKSA